MILTQQIAKHFREIHFGGNWTVSNLKETLSDVTWEQATTQVQSFNTIAILTFHMNYFVSVVLRVFQGQPLTGNDKLSFDVPPITSQKDWEKLVNKSLTEAEELAKLIEKMPEERLWEDFTDKKFGNYYRNLHGIIEHSHYHLGQISLIKKIISEK
ncbi:MAG: DUF1572 domain-containing protein [Calditrichaeota bacterium]|nr:MAG: DUF1572 domain-containing protein [Calditrichota bacterium]